MATEHTVLMGLESLMRTDDFVPSFRFNHFIRLDEGHDRPVWESLSSNAKLIPFSPEDIIVSGVYLLAKINSNDQSFIDLSELQNLNEVDSHIKNTLVNHVVHIYPLHISSLAQIENSLRSFDKLGIKYKVYKEIENILSL